jgi:hypothetical protein
MLQKGKIKISIYITGYAEVQAKIVLGHAQIRPHPQP